jgi:hypothetical protein
LNTAKASGGSGGGSDQSMLSLMLEVEELKSKVTFCVSLWQCG